MRVAVTGTPGTGKTSAVELVETDSEKLHLNELIREEGLHTGEDADRGSLYADMDALAERIPDDALFESHLAHNFAAETVVVLRCAPAELERRLLERESEAKARENAESEALDVILSEAVAQHGEGAVYEIETTDRTPGEVAAEIEAVLDGERAPSAGTVDYTDWL
jgi:adenylate kinase